MHRERILAIDDEKNIRHLLRSELSLEGFDVSTARTGEEGLKLLGKQGFELVLLDIRLPKVSGIDVLRSLKRTSPRTQVIMITGYGDISTAVESMKLGAYDYITKPFKLSELLAVVNQAITQNRFLENTAGTGETDRAAPDSPFLRCPSGSMAQVYDLADRVASTDVTVLIKGETGVGKDVLAFYLHSQSSRRARPFVVVDCGLLNDNLAESELYGHTKGAFSGALELKQGLVEKSSDGTIFFDEIGNVELNLQKKFLRFLETKKFRRVGETKEREVDARIILATNLDLEGAAERGALRKDLLFRMDVVSITVPPLRERPEDVAVLAQHFADANSVDRRPKKVSVEALARLGAYAWPGNVRELRSVMTKASVFVRSDVIRPQDLPSHVRSEPESQVCAPKSLEEIEREHIVRVLEQAGGNQSVAAGILGINRKTLYKKIHKYGIFA